MEVKGPAMEDTQLMLPQICECNGLLLMVEVVSEQFLMTRVTIWALQSIGSQWFKMASMPNHLLEEVISISGTHFECFLKFQMFCGSWVQVVLCVVCVLPTSEVHNAYYISSHVT